MREKKNIDRLFQEKFKDFEVHPGNHVWEKIAASKEQKEDRKLIPFWLRLGGIAAALAVLLTLGITLFNSDALNSDTVVDTESTLPNENNTSAEDKEETKSIGTPPINLISNETANNGIATNETQDSEGSSNETVHSNMISQQGSLTPTSATNNKATTTSQNAVAQVTNTSDKLKTNQYTTLPNTANTALTTVAQNKDKNTAVTATNNDKNQFKSPDNFKKPQNTLGTDKTENAVAQNNISENKDITENPEASKKDLVEEAKRIEATKEGEAVASVDKESNNKRWNVGAVAAPVYYGDFGGSGIDPEFKDNKKSGDVNLSYGVQVSYALNDKFKVRTGVNSVDLSYGTEDIAFSPDIQARELRGVNYAQNAQFLSISDSSNQTNAFTESDVQGGGSSVTPGSLNQQVAYVEIPLEAVYVVSDKRFGVELIGGVSTLILNDDSISLESEGGLRTTLGDSNSLNEVSLTTNIGVGLNYKITENVKVNMEPSFKYQINAFDQSVGDFKPYYIGLYTGVSYRF